MASSTGARKDSISSVVSNDSISNLYIAKPPAPDHRQQHKDASTLGDAYIWLRDPDVQPRVDQAYAWLTSTKARFRGRDGRPARWEDLDFFTQAGLITYFVRPVGDRREFQGKLRSSTEDLDISESVGAEKWGERRFGWLAKTEIDPRDEMRRIDLIIAPEQRIIKDSVLTAVSGANGRQASRKARKALESNHEQPGDFRHHAVRYETLEFTDASFTMLARDQPSVRDSWHSSKTRHSTVSQSVYQQFKSEGRRPWKVQTGINASQG